MTGPRPRCPRTGKVVFATSGAAQRALARILDAPDDGRLYRPVGHLFCRACRGHHLTSSHTERRDRRGATVTRRSR